MTKRLTTKAIRYAMNQLEKGKRTSVMAAELGVTPRYIRRLWAKFRETGSAHVPLPPDRPALQPPSQDEVRLVLDAYWLEKAGVLRTAISMRRTGHDTSYQRVCRITKENRLVVPSASLRNCDLGNKDLGIIQMTRVGTAYRDNIYLKYYCTDRFAVTVPRLGVLQMPSSALVRTA